MHAPQAARMPAACAQRPGCGLDGPLLCPPPGRPRPRARSCARTACRSSRWRGTSSRRRSACMSRCRPSRQAVSDAACRAHRAASGSLHAAQTPVRAAQACGPQRHTAGGSTQLWRNRCCSMHTTTSCRGERQLPAACRPSVCLSVPSTRSACQPTAAWLITLLPSAASIRPFWPTGQPRARWNILLHTSSAYCRQGTHAAPGAGSYTVF